MGGCQNYGPFLGPYYSTAPSILGTQKGTIILTTTHVLGCVSMGYIEPSTRYSGDWNLGCQRKLAAKALDSGWVSYGTLPGGELPLWAIRPSGYLKLPLIGS